MTEDQFVEEMRMCRRGALEEGRRNGMEEAVRIVAGCAALDTNGYICEKSVAIRAIRLAV